MATLRMSCDSLDERFGCADRARRYAESLGMSRRASLEVALVVAELGSNAVKFALRGELQVSPGAPGELAIVCADSGPGFDPRAVPESVDPSQRRSGLGVGLQSIRRMATHVEIDSRLGAGTTVTARMRI